MGWYNCNDSWGIEVRRDTGSSKAVVVGVDRVVGGYGDEVVGPEAAL